MRLLLFASLLFCVYHPIKSQGIADGFLKVKASQSVYAPGDTLFFTVLDESKKIPDNALIHVEWLDEVGRKLDFQYLSLNQGKVCGYFENKKIISGPTMLRAYFTSNAQPMHISRDFVFIDSKKKNQLIEFPDSLYPYIINAKYTTVDIGFTNYYFIKEKFKKSTIQYQLVDENGDIQFIDQAERINDSVFRVANVDFKGKGSIRLFVNNEMEYKDYDGFSIEPADKKGLIVWDFDSISRKAMAYVKNNLQQSKKSNKAKSGEADFTNYTKEGLPDVVVNSVVKSKEEELNNKYVQNGFFRNNFSQSVNVLEDPTANTNLTVQDYVLQKFPVITLKNGELRYRNGTIDIFVDESRFSALPENLRDIAYVKFIKATVRGLNEGGGALLPGSKAAPAGVTATLAFYIKKGDEPLPNNKLKTISFPIVGIQSIACKE
ncbi:MAG: hypothetical protein WCP74_08335 [Sphingobacteriia bacterium]|jgi:hypothetical protein